MPADNSQPATKQDIVEVKQNIVEVKQDIVEVKQDIIEVKQNIVEVKQNLIAVQQGLVELKREFSTRMSEMEDRLVEKMRDMQTEVLTAFHGWARPVDIKLRTLPMIDERLGLLEERISQLERERPRPH